jgi:hypothetical protein
MIASKPHTSSDFAAVRSALRTLAGDMQIQIDHLHGWKQLNRIEEQKEAADVEIGRLRDALIDILTISEGKGGQAKYGTIAKDALYPASALHTKIDFEPTNQDKSHD